jgi:hypothetical protein
MINMAIRSSKQNKRVLRGGSWNNNGRNCRSAIRNHNTAENRNNNIGFRLSLAPNAIGIRVIDQISSLTYCVLSYLNTFNPIGKPQGRCMVGNKLTAGERHAAGRTSQCARFIVYSAVPVGFIQPNSSLYTRAKQHWEPEQ